MSGTRDLMLAQAIDYLAEGLSVIPCRPQSKEPAIPWKEYQTAAADEETVRDWFDGADNNLAIVCGAVSGGLVVLDFDDAEGFEAWRKDNDFIKGAPIVRTSRGYHVYVRVKDRTIESRRLPGLDIQSDGHYIIASPSVHPSGAHYELVEGSLDDIPVVPANLIDGLSGKREESVGAKTKGGVAEGSRNNSLFSLGCRLRNAGEPPETVLAHLREANAHDCQPPLGDDEVVQIAESVERTREKENRLVEELQGLSLFQFSEQKDALVVRYGIDKTTLAKIYAKVHPASQGAGEGEGPTVPEDPKPFDEPVEGDQLLVDIRDQVRRFVVLDDEAATTVALWIALTYLVEKASYLGILAIESAMRRCGKTALIKVLNRLVHRVKRSENITAPALFRIISQSRPTLLIDEADSFLKGNEDLRGILNAGVEPGGTVMRCEDMGGGFVVREYDVFGAKAIALIGKMPPTLEDRSFVIRLRRRKREETIERLRGDKDLGFEMLQRGLVTWTASIAPGFNEIEPEEITSLNDRAADRWRDMLRIAKAAGGHWPERARRAAEKIEADQGDEEAKTLLLEDLRMLFAQTPERKVSHSQALVDDLKAIEGRPWADWNNGKSLTTNGLAKLLRDFGIKSRQVNLHGQNLQGYRVEDFQDVFARYLPERPYAPDSAEK